MRVLQIAKYMYPFMGGTEQVTRDLVGAFNAVGVENKVICFNEDSADGDVVTHRKETVTDKVDSVEVLRVASKAKVLSQAIAPEYKKNLTKVLDEFKPDVIIFHYPNPYVASKLLSYIKKNGKNFKLYIYWHLDITKQKFVRAFFRGQDRALINASDKILGATPIHLEMSRYSAEFGDKKYILPYMIADDTLVLNDEEKEVAKKIREENNGKIIGFFIGRHVAYKGLDYLIEAVKKTQSAKLLIIIAGDGEDNAKLKAQAEGVDKIRFIGRIDDSTKRSYLEASDLTIFPSVTRSEGFGLALAEGMFFGKPAITFTIPGSGVNYLCQDKLSGIECPLMDTDAYAKALDTLAEDDALRAKYGESARREILAKYTKDRFIANVKKLLEEDT
ncbi:MAG: glycosyltransferase [Saccharofermentans sp.]|nr:glycosyltransferase [Saccharofermentans sp.]